MSVNQRPKVAYGLSQPYFATTPFPVVSTRAPLTSDFAEIGTIWIDSLTNQIWVLTRVAANIATWVEVDGGAAPTGLTWVTVGGLGPIPLANNRGYYLTGNGGAIHLVLPAVSPLGTQVWITTQDVSGVGDGIEIEQAAGQTIKYADQVTTAGAATNFSVIDQRSASVAIIMVCTVANSEWTVMSSSVNPDLI